jgi:hypothetical protein
VLVLLADRVGHDRARHGVGLDGQPLLVPVDRVRLLGQRGAETGEGPGLRGQFLRGLVVLVESHGGELPDAGEGANGIRPFLCDD